MAKAKAPKPTWVRDGTIVTVTDGDTFVVRFDLGMRVLVVDSVRLRGINCPEKTTPEGKKVLAYVKGLLPEGTPVTVETFKNPEEKYGRWLARVFKDDLCINDHLLEKKMAVVYNP